MRVFVAWDMQRCERVMPNVEVLAGSLAPEVMLDALGLYEDEPFGDLWDDLVAARVRDADRLLAVMDGPNANVGFELGYAAGLGKPLALVTSLDPAHSWTAQPPLLGQRVRRATETPAQLEGVLRSGEWVTVPPPGEPTGDKVLLVAPGAACAAFREAVTKVPVAWKPLPEDAGLPSLPALLGDVRRVVWIVPAASAQAAPDDPESAAAAVVVGYALACGREVRLFRHEKSRGIADSARRTESFLRVPKLVEGVRAWLTPVAAPADPVAAWKAGQVAELSRATPFHARLSGMELERVCVAVGVEARAEKGEERWLHDLRGASLGELLDRSGHRAWFVAADPGAGKTTAARRLALDLARAEGASLPVYLPLADVADKLVGAADPEEVVWRLAARAHKNTDQAPLVPVARAAGRQGATVLLDGLDEVPPRLMTDVLATIARLPAAMPTARIVVLTRSVMLERHPAPEPYRVATLLRLEEDEQAKLVGNLAGADGPWVMRALTERPTLRDLARNPLMLTLLTLVALDARDRGSDLPVRRAEVYGAAVDYLLRRGHQGGGDTRGVKEPRLAAKLLAPMAFYLTKQDGVTWTPWVMDEAVWAARKGVGEEVDWRFQKTWGTNGAFLEDLAHNAGICAPEHGTGSSWRFLHNTLREYLAAVDLVGRGEEGVAAFEREWMEAVGRWEKRENGEAPEGEPANAEPPPPPTDPARWGEVHALYCGLTASPERALARLRERSQTLFARALPQADVSAGVAARLLADPDLWTGEHPWLDDCVLALATVHGAPISGPLHDLLTDRSPTFQVGLLSWALETVGVFDPADVFRRARPGITPPTIEAVDIPAGEFWMGSPAGVGDDDEHPRHLVTVSRPFRLGRTTVRADEWHTFAGGAAPRKPRLPAVGITWYEAWLYCRWVGGDLPTEAEWEYACRAGTDTRWSFGDDEAKLGEYAWFAKNGGHTTHDVATRKPNPWGLYDMHGNVWEWCRDDRRDYAEAPLVDPVATTPAGAPGWRAFRGGAFWYVADRCRSAYRVRGHPGSRNGDLGFRVRLPPP